MELLLAPLGGSKNSHPVAARRVGMQMGRQLETSLALEKKNW